MTFLEMAAELAAARVAWAIDFLRYRAMHAETDKKAVAMADVDNAERLTMAEARYELAKWRLTQGEGYVLVDEQALRWAVDFIEGTGDFCSYCPTQNEDMGGCTCGAYDLMERLSAPIRWRLREDTDVSAPTPAPSADHEPTEATPDEESPGLDCGE